MACPPGGDCTSKMHTRMCKPLPPVLLDPSQDLMQLYWWCWRAESTGEYTSGSPILLTLDKDVNLAAVEEYCRRRGTLADIDLKKIEVNVIEIEGGEDPVSFPPNPPTSDPLVVVCTPSNCTIDCSDAFPSLVFTASGGTPPYTWVNGTGGVLTISGASNQIATLTPAPTVNNFPGVAAYTNVLLYCAAAPCAGAGANKISWTNFDCDGAIIGACNDAIDTASNQSGCPGGDPTSPCFAGTCGNTCLSGHCFGVAEVDAGLAANLPCIAVGSRLGSGDPCDKRTSAMIADGCAPCGLQMEGGIITAKDAVLTTILTTVTTLG